MRPRLIATLLMLVTAFVLAPVATSTAHASDALYCSISQIDQDAQTLSSRRAYLRQHRNHATWNRYRPAVMNTLSSAGSCFRGAAASTWGQLSNRFYVDAAHYRYKAARGDLTQAIRVLNSIVADYRAGHGCSFCG